MMRHPSRHEFKELVCEKLITNCPITLNDVANGYKIFGPDLEGLRGKTVRRDPTRIQPKYMEISQKS